MPSRSTRRPRPDENTVPPATDGRWRNRFTWGLRRGRRHRAGDCGVTVFQAPRTETSVAQKRSLHQLPSDRDRAIVSPEGTRLAFQ